MRAEVEIWVGSSSCVRPIAAVGPKVNAVCQAHRVRIPG